MDVWLATVLITQQVLEMNNIALSNCPPRGHSYRILRQTSKIWREKTNLMRPNYSQTLPLNKTTLCRQCGKYGKEQRQQHV